MRRANIADGKQEPEYSNDAEIVVLDPKASVPGPTRKPTTAEHSTLRRAQLKAERREEMRRRAEKYAMNHEIFPILPERENDQDTEL